MRPTVKYAFFQYDFGIGGIQRALINLLGSGIFAKDQVDVFYCEEGELFSEIQKVKGIHLKQIESFSRLARFVPFNILYHTKKAVSEQAELYDAAIDFNSYQPECAVGVLNCLARQHIIWIHNDVEKVYENEPKFRVLWNFGKGKYKYFDRFVGVSDGVIKPFCRMSGCDEADCTVIPNWLDAFAIQEKADEKIQWDAPADKVNLVMVGRLCKQKGIELLLMDLAGAVLKASYLHLWIIGDGPLRGKLEKKTEQLGLKKHVTFLGNITNPYPYIKRMDAMVLESLYEGQGIVLWEAKALGVPTIFPKRLEAYNRGLTGTDNMVEAMRQVAKNTPAPDNLEGYCGEIRKGLKKLFAKSGNTA